MIAGALACVHAPVDLILAAVSFPLCFRVPQIPPFIILGIFHTYFAHFMHAPFLIFTLLPNKDEANGGQPSHHTTYLHPPRYIT